MQTTAERIMPTRTALHVNAEEPESPVFSEVLFACFFAIEFQIA
jgi:hypothetical protein